MRTYNDAFLDVRKRLKNENIGAYSLEARLLIMAAADKTKEEYVRDMRLYAPEDFEEKLTSLVERRINGEPVAYITGEWEFFSLPINVTPDVLIPRVDTELIAGLSIEFLRTRKDQSLRVLDLCCGSGCIGLAIAANVPNCRVVLADNSPKALHVCRSNMMRNNLTRSTGCIETDALEAPPMLIGKFDLIVCNPPYIATEELKTLDESVIGYEPVTALDGGDDGLDFYRRIIPLWKAVLKENGCMMFECGKGQAEKIAVLMDQCGYTNIGVFRDNQGIERVIKGFYR